MRQLADASPEAQHQALLEVAEAIAQHRDLGELFHELAARLHRVVEFDYLDLILHDATRNVMRVHILEAEEPRTIRPGAEFAVGETPSGWVWETQQPYVLNDAEEETRFPALLQILRENGGEVGLLGSADDGAAPPGRAELRPPHSSSLRRNRNRLHAAGGAASRRGGG